MLSRATDWFVRSGIQEDSGGIARYYRTDHERNAAISTEITGYTVSALLSLKRSCEALAAARYLTRVWDGNSMPFEAPRNSGEGYTYFFDCGIVVRGLLARWRSTHEPEFLDVATELGNAMIADFTAEEGHYHPILSLPDKEPVQRDSSRWSQSTGCYQLKSGLAWWELFEAIGASEFRQAYEGLLETALACYRTFLPGHSDPLKVVDRLHAFLYFLEGILPHTQEELCAEALCEGIRRVAHLVSITKQKFERSDVYAQLLRIRIYADWAGVAPLDRAAAEHEATALTEFQAASADPRIDGGFYFGRRAGNWLPYVNPVSTAFAAQTLALWDQYSNGGDAAGWPLLI